MKKEKVFDVRVRTNILKGKTPQQVRIEDCGKSDAFNDEMYKNALDGKSLVVSPLTYPIKFKNWYRGNDGWCYHKSWLIFLDKENDLFDF